MNILFLEGFGFPHRLYIECFCCRAFIYGRDPDVIFVHFVVVANIKAFNWKQTKKNKQNVG